MENTENKDQQGQDNNKVEKKYNENVSKLTAMFKGNQDIVRKKKIKNSALDVAIDELLEEETKSRVETFKIKAKKLLQSKVEFDKFVSEQQKQMEQAILNKKKEFNKEMDDCFQLVENLEEMKKSYKASLGGAEIAAPEEDKN
jgi:hypothetical protein